MTNPLENYYRSREVYISLPTQGKYYEEISNLSIDGELGVMPMTAKDEMLLKIPDTLFNGTAIYQLIESVTPDIKNPYDLKMPDLDAILTATRIATHGKELNVSAICPHCDTEGFYSVDLTSLLARIKPISDNDEVKIGELKVKLQPNSVASITAKSMSISKSIAIRNQLGDEETEENQKIFKEAMNIVTAAEMAILADSILYVELPDGNRVTEKQHIIDWLSDTNSSAFKNIRELAQILNQSGIPQTYTFKCGNEECEKEFVSSLDMNPSFFFTTSIDKQ